MRLIHPTNLANFSMLQTSDYDVYFSYETPIAYVGNNIVLVCENKWKQTTGKHINYVKRQYPAYALVQHERLVELLDDLQGGNTEHDNRYSDNNLTEPGLFERLSNTT